MKAILLEYATYHNWANNRFYNRLKGIDPSLWRQELPGSFPSLHKTILHMWDAEAIWWQRVHKAEKLEIPSQYFTGQPMVAFEEYLKLGEQWKSWVEALPEDNMHQTFSYKNLSGKPFESSYSHLMLHLYNHGTYHRGQLVSMMHQLSLGDIPSTDFIVWSRTG